MRILTSVFFFFSGSLCGEFYERDTVAVRGAEDVISGKFTVNMADLALYSDISMIPCRRSVVPLIGDHHPSSRRKERFTSVCHVRLRSFGGGRSRRVESRDIDARFRCAIFIAIFDSSKIYERRKTSYLLIGMITRQAIRYRSDL